METHSYGTQEHRRHPRTPWRTATTSGRHCRTVRILFRRCPCRRRRPRQHGATNPAQPNTIRQRWIEDTDDDLVQQRNPRGRPRSSLQTSVTLAASANNPSSHLCSATWVTTTTSASLLPAAQTRQPLFGQPERLPSWPTCRRASPQAKHSATPCISRY